MKNIDKRENEEELKITSQAREDDKERKNYIRLFREGYRDDIVRQNNKKTEVKLMHVEE